MSAFKKLTKAGSRLLNKNQDQYSIAGILAIGLAFLVIYFLLPGYTTYILMSMIAYILFAVSWGLLYNFSGQLSLGQAMPFGIGGFISAIVFVVFHLNPFLCTFVGALGGAGVGGSIGASTLKLKPAYQGIALLVFSQIFYWLFLIWYGEEGISFGIYHGVMIASISQIFYFGLIILIISLLLLYFFETSKLGVKFKAIKGDPVAAEAIGIPVIKYKIIIFYISSFFAALGGAFYAFYTFHVDFSTFLVSNSFLSIAMSIVGGPSLFGTLFGAVLLDFLIQTLPVYTSLAITYLFYGIITILVLRFAPGGIESLIKRLLK